MICPHHCVCQYAHRMDLSVSRWIKTVETRQRKGHEFVDSSEDLTNSNEVKLRKFLSYHSPSIGLFFRSPSMMRLHHKTMNY